MDPVVAHCEAMLRSGSRSFYRAASVLPQSTRHGAYQLYAWGRYCDDRIDSQELGHGQRAPTLTRDGQRAVLAELRRLTGAALDGDAMERPEFVALQRVATAHAIPRELPFQLLDGMAMDVEGRRYQSIGDLVVYCHHVAGVLGMMAAHVMGSPDPRVIALTCDLGIAFQLTNTARDVIDDAGAGRVYLPLDWLAESGVDPDAVAAPAARPQIANVVSRVLDHADTYYERVDRSLSDLPFRLAWAVAAARGIYADIGTVIRRRGPKAWERRAVVPAPAKLLWLGRGFTRALLVGSGE
jgi:phytoene synthase